MTNGDIHRRANRIKKVIECINAPDTVSEEDKQLLTDFKDYLYSQDLSDARISRYLYSGYRMLPHIEFSLSAPEKKDLVRLVGKINKSEIKDSEMADSTKGEYRKAVRKFYADFMDTNHDLEGKELCGRGLPLFLRTRSFRSSPSTSRSHL